MPDLHSATMLLAVLCLLQLLFSAAWLVAGLRLHVAREGSLHWAVFCLGIAATTAVYLVAGPQASGFAVGLRATAMIVAMLALRRGLNAFLALPRQDLDAGLILAGHLTVLVAFGLIEDSRQDRALAQSFLVAWILLSGLRPQCRALAKEFGPAVAVLCCGTLLAGALGFGTRAVTFALGLHAPSAGMPTNLNVGFVALMVVLAVAFNFLFGYMVVARLVRALQWQSLHDDMTGLHNRRSFDHLLAQERHRSQRSAQPLSVLVVDIDHFKSINDSLGHAAGDEVLKSVAAAMTSSSRQTDMLSRMGGEEFALLLPDTDRDGARLHAERIREAIGTMIVRWQAQSLRVTVSIGVATWLADAGAQDDPMQAADRALYLAKANGRNRVEVAPDA